jgi:mannose-1-phosphate guanylyltransferase
MPVSAMLLAAGKSTRIAPIGEGLPKPLLIVGGQPILVRNVRWLRAAGVRDVWVNLHYRGDLIREVLNDGRAWAIRVHYSEEPEILGTAGGVRKVLSSLGETFLVVYGDNLVDFDLQSFVAAHLRSRAAVTIAVFDHTVPNTGMAGGTVSLSTTGEIEGFVEGGPRAIDARFVSAGVYAVQRAAIGGFPEGRFLDWGKDVFPVLLAERQRLVGYRIEGYCLGLDTPERYERGMSLVASGQVTLR